MQSSLGCSWMTNDGKRQQASRLLKMYRLNHDSARKRDRVLRKSFCERCGSSSNLHAHHIDIENSREVITLCYYCHWCEHGWPPPSFENTSGNVNSITATDNAIDIVRRGRPAIPAHRRRNIALYVSKATRTRLEKIDRNPEKAILKILGKLKSATNS